MYLKDYPVPVPCDRKGIIIRNEKRVELESDRAYSTETKDTRVKRKTIGMLLPLFPEQMYPNENYFELVPENTVPADIRDAFLRRCERKKEIDRLKKDPAAMARRIADGIRALKEKGREIAMAQGKEIDEKEARVWYISDEYDLEYVMKVFSDLYSLMESYAAKDPHRILGTYQVKMFNEILKELKATLPDHWILQKLELIEEPREETGPDGTSYMTGKSNSDVLMLLTWYKNAIRT